jgi:ribonucleoside-diphosphate reductase alpha chain
LIRPKGAPISWGGKAPGPEGLKNALEKIKQVIENRLSFGENKLRAIDCYDIVMHASDAVLSGGIRRSATICIFSPEDDEMCNAKTGDWFIKNPQRGRSNNSALLIRSETTSEQFAKLMKSVREFGEPGFVWSDDKEALYNPCVEIGMRAYTEDGRSGWQFCNLTEINGRKMKTREDFLEACKASAILGTIQASYDKFNYLSKETEEIVKREALLGCSVTGVMDNPQVTLDPEIQKEGAKLILDINEKISKKIGINKCARATCVKPAGSTSCILGTASGIHPHHSKRYIRRVQANKLEFPVNHFMKFNPNAVEESVWSNNKTDLVISFLCEVPEGARTKNQVGAIDLLKSVMSTQQNWVEYGTRYDVQMAPWLRHNVSNTITVQETEWSDVENFIYENRKWFAGISLLPASGDLDYPQAPFTTVLTEKEIVAEYGEGALFASGLIVDGLAAFNGNLWAACDTALGIGERLEEIGVGSEPVMPVKNGYTDKVFAEKLASYAIALKKFHEDLESSEIMRKKIDWVRRFQQFADRYVEGNKRKTSHLLKHVHNRKLWLDLSRVYKEVNWTDLTEEDYKLDVSTIGAAACAGGRCETV